MSRQTPAGGGRTTTSQDTAPPPPVARAPRRRAAPAGETPSSAATAHIPRDDRLQSLRAVYPHLDLAITEALRAAVVATLAEAAYVNDQVDRTRASILYRYAAHMHTVHGHFDPNRNLLEEHLVQYWSTACTDLTPRSRDKALSVLRTIASQRPFADGLLMRRPPTSAPLSDSYWRALRVATDRLTDRQWSNEAHMLLDLSGEAGLRGAEINQIRGSDLTGTGPTITATISAKGSRRQRVVPISGHAAARLAPHTGSTLFLLRPHYRNRKNAVSSLVTRLAVRDGTFANFRAAEARHRWIAQLLTEPAPVLRTRWVW